MRKVLVLALLLLLLPLRARGLEIPKLGGYVNDYANMISGPVRARLEAELRAFEQSDSTQLVILTIPSLQGEPIEDYGIKVAEAWKLGQARKDNGVLFLVSRDDRKMRIEVGRGLEGRLTDLMAGRIIDLVVKPNFKRGAYDEGFKAGVASLIDAVRGEFQAEGRESRGGSRPFPSSWLFLVSLFILFFIFASLARSGAKSGMGASQGGRGRSRYPGGVVILPPRRGRGWSSGDDYFGGGGGGFGGGGGTFGGGGASGSW